MGLLEAPGDGCLGMVDHGVEGRERQALDRNPLAQGRLCLQENRRGHARVLHENAGTGRPLQTAAQAEEFGAPGGGTGAA